MRTGIISRELRLHSPFTALGAVTGIVIMVVVTVARVPRGVSTALFWTLHPLHILLSALVTAGMYKLHSRGGLLQTLVVGYIGSVGIATLSDSVIPYVGEWLLHLPNRSVHIGFIEKWWLVNPLALAGAACGHVRPWTRFPHAGHVLLSTWASVFHIVMALGSEIDAVTCILVTLFLFLAVWVPCCTSDIVFPLLWVDQGNGKEPLQETANGGES